MPLVCLCRLSDALHTVVDVDIIMSLFIKDVAKHYFQVCIEVHFIHIHICSAELQPWDGDVLFGSKLCSAEEEAYFTVAISIGKLQVSNSTHCFY